MWMTAATVRLLKTFIECFAAMLLTGHGLAESLLVAFIAAALSGCVSLVGVPEVDEGTSPLRRRR
jgi:hypothetical protein